MTINQKIAAVRRRAELAADYADLAIIEALAADCDLDSAELIILDPAENCGPSIVADCDRLEELDLFDIDTAADLDDYLDFWNC